MKNLLFIILSFSFFNIFSQSNDSDISIYIDCNSCNKTLIKQELKNVSFVRDQNDADVHIFFTTQYNASNGKSYELEFIGKNEYNKLHDNLYFDTNADMSELEVTNKILKYIQLGLMRFWIKNGLADKISVNIATDNTDKQTEKYDPWNKWSFRIGANGWFNGQEKSSFHNIHARISADRITDENKFSFSFSLSQNKSVFLFGEDEIISKKNSISSRVYDVISINQHLSTGLFLNGGNSIFNNYKLYLSVQPGIEYNFFPYSKSSKKQAIIRYKAGARYNGYYETTIFNIDNELLWNESLTLGTTFRKKWGSISAELQYENYIHDFSLNELNAYLNTDIRLFKGLSLRIFGSYGITHNQINIRAAGATLEEMLLQQKQIKSGYNYYGSIGLSYSFGSIYNSVVNSRFK